MSGQALTYCDEFRVAVNGEMRSRVDDLLGPSNFRLITAAPSTAGAGRGNGRSRR